MDTMQLIRNLSTSSTDRFGFWSGFINSARIRNAVEIGIFRGDFAEQILRDCPGLEKYYMIDPWRNLGDWDKPANADDRTLEMLMQRSLERTAFAGNKRVVLRGKTTEVIDLIPDNSLDFAYIDGDHTLKGITIDLIKVFPKVRVGGFISGDDFCPGDLQHFPQFEPTLVFPFAIHFAEAVSARIFALPHDQFLIEKGDNSQFELVDLTGKINGTGLKNHILTATSNSPG